MNSLALTASFFLVSVSLRLPSRFFLCAGLPPMSRWSWKGCQLKRTRSEPWQWKEQDNLPEDVKELPLKLTLKQRNPWLTPTESCASDEPEEEEERLALTPLACRIPLAKISEDPTRGTNCMDFAAVGPRTLKTASEVQMKDIRRFEGIVTEQSSDKLQDQARFSILSCNAGVKRGKVTNSVVGSFCFTSMRPQRVPRNSSSSAVVPISSF